jgi:hypothetical protein
MKTLYQNVLRSPVGIIYNQDSEDSFKVCIYREYSNYGSNCVVDGSLLSSQLSEKTIEISSPFQFGSLTPTYDVSLYGLSIEPSSFSLVGFSSILEETYVSKRSVGGHAKNNSVSYIAQLFVPSVTSTLKDCGLLLMANKDFPIITDRWPHWENNFIKEFVPCSPLYTLEDCTSLVGTGVNPIFPVLSLTGNSTVQAESYLNLFVQTYHKDGTVWPLDGFTVYLQSTGGYLPLNRVQLKNGQAKFKIGALGLAQGDKFKVKIGTKYFTGMNEKEITVI